MHYHYLVITLVGWPDGIILGNLLASVVWSALFEWRIRVHHNRMRDHVAAVLQGKKNQASDGTGVRKKER
jgi:hypothetical protein